MNARFKALQILLHFERETNRLDSLFNLYLDDQHLLAKERKFVFNLVSGVVRHRSLFDWKVSSIFKGNYKKSLITFKNILRLAIYELDCLDFIPPHATLNEYVALAKKKLPAAQFKTVNAILRTYQREGRGLDPNKKFKYADTRIAVKYSFPEWLTKRWLNFWPEEFVEKMCASMNERPVYDIRINLKKTNTDTFVKKLVRESIEFEPSEHFPHVVRLSDIQSLIKSGLLQEGECSVQDESGQIVTEFIQLNQGDLLLDACAAPGGKYTALLEKEGIYKIVALEKNWERLRILSENCQRLGLKGTLIVQGDAGSTPLKKNQFDKILVDAPCSGLGTIQKHPDIKWRRTLEEVLEFHDMQIEILMEVDRLLKPGGELVYSTCTIDPAENESVIEEFIEKSSGRYHIIAPAKEFIYYLADEKYIRTYPHIHQMEGSFAAKLQKSQSD
jgi:16S rRNA (cytosine967-C5)-methyltransferase